MLRRLVVALFLLLTAFAAAQGGINQTVVSGSVGLNANLAGVSVEQKIGAVPPLDVPLTDEKGRATNMGRLFRGRPLVLLPIFYRCNGVCTTEMQGVLNALGKNRDLVPGRDLDIVVLGLNPKETPDLARAKKAEYLDAYGHRETADGWTFLTAPEDRVQKVATALGVHYTYDPEHDRVNHPSAVLVLTPGARVSAYELSGMVPPARFAADVRRAGRDELSKAVSDESWLGCVHVDPVTGKRSIVVQGVLRVLGVLVVLGLVTAMAVLSRRGRSSIAA